LTAQVADYAVNLLPHSLADDFDFDANLNVGGRTYGDVVPAFLQ
jgi:hypothetical protein